MASTAFIFLAVLSACLATQIKIDIPEVKYTLTPRLEPWGIQRSEENMRYWGEDVFWQNTPGVRITFPSTDSVNKIETETWELAGWGFKFIQLKKGKSYKIPQTGHLNHLVVHRGKLKTNTGENFYQVMAAPEDIISTYIDETVTKVTAKKDTIFSIWALDPARQHQELNHMTPDPFTTQRDPILRGLYGNNFKWVRFEEFFGGPVPFDSDFFNLRGFEVYDSEGERIMYVQFWTAGQNVNCGYHDHQDLSAHTSYAELHMTLAFGGGGMQWFDENDVEQDILLLPEGWSHGALWHRNEDWTPIRNDGVVSYPTHRWINPGMETNSTNAYDLWAVFEYPDITSTAYSEEAK